MKPPAGRSGDVSRAGLRQDGTRRRGPPGTAGAGGWAGGAPRPGRTTAWISTSVGLVAGQAASPLASYLALVDTANGIAVRRPPTAWMFPNVDLTVHSHRRPEGNWTGLDTTVVFGPAGQGVTSTVLHDLAGPVGHAQQMLTVRPLPAAEGP